MSRWRTVFLAAFVLLATMATAQARAALRMYEQGNAHLVLGIIFTLLLLYRQKQPSEKKFTSQGSPRPWFIALTALTGVLLVFTGRFANINQFSWTGLILLIYVALRNALPLSYGKDIFRSLFVFYWIHPLPNQLISPLQLLMQRVSVRGAEWLLHALNIRVWADGLMLDAGTQLFGVPEACSGMTTAMTVFLCLFGVGMLMRFNALALVVLQIVGMAQVLLLNSMRIAAMIYFSRGAGEDWSSVFLHDTLGLLLFAAVALSFGEAAIWRSRRNKRLNIQAAIKNGSAEPPDRATILPPFWRRLVRWGWLAAFTVVVVLGSAFAVYRARPYHRGRMIHTVAERRLGQLDTARAHRAVNAALSFIPDDYELLMLKVRILVFAGHPAEALHILQEHSEKLATEEGWVLKSNALMMLGRHEDAMAILMDLPDNVRQVPGVALLLAEYAALSGNIGDVIRYLPDAARTHVNLPRVRALFPFLAAHEQWGLIVACDRVDYAYADAQQAELSLRAHLVRNKLTDAGRILSGAINRWPDDPRFLYGLVAISTAMPGSEWEERFVSRFAGVMPQLAPDPLAHYLRHALLLGRTDQAWVGYTRLVALDSSDPDVYLLPAEFAEQWMSVRRHGLHLPAEDRAERINLVGLMRFTGQMAPWRNIWEAVPRFMEVSDTAFYEVRPSLLAKGIEALAQREASGRLTRRMEMSWPQAMALSGRFDEAHMRLDILAERYPELRQHVNFMRAVFYDQQGRWAEAYEAVRLWRSESHQPRLTADLIMINALMNLNVVVAALDVAEKALGRFPAAPEPEQAVAAIWDVFGYKDYALHLLTEAGRRRHYLVMARLLYETGRYDQSARMARLSGMPPRQRDLDAAAAFVVLPAEAVFQSAWPPPLSGEQMIEQGKAVKVLSEASASPFVRSMGQMMADWYMSEGSEETSDPGRWKSAGRDARESAGMLHRLASLQARQQRMEAAVAAIDVALEQLPDSPVLWRMRLAMSFPQERDVIVAAAHDGSPRDPDVWLAGVVHYAFSGDEDRLESYITEALNLNFLPNESLVRAADYLLRNERLDQARQLASKAVQRERTFLPALVVSIRAAVEAEDWPAVLSGALTAVEVAADPAPFYELVVAVKAREKVQDMEMLRALEFLYVRYPEQSEWAEVMAKVFFERGDTDRALTILGPLIDRDISGVRILSVLLAAESERLAGNPRRALSILEEAYQMYPDRLSVLNNLAYTMLEVPDKAAHALEFVPALLSLGGDNVAVLDTVARIYKVNGRMSEAWEIMQRCLAELDHNSPSAAEILLNAAELLYTRGDQAAAGELVTAVMRRRDLPRLLEFRARSIREQLSRQKNIVE